MSQRAIIHDWLPVIGGAEHVVKEMVDVTGAKDIFTLFDFLTEAERAYFGDVKIHTSALQSWPAAEHYYRYLINACTRAIESFDLRAFDTVVSSSACYAKGVLTGADQTHIAYIHSPPRYAWDLTHEYLENARGWLGLKRWIAARAFYKLRMWDVRTIHAMDTVLANSQFVARRIQKLYGRTPEILYPPVNTAQFSAFADTPRDDHYVIACRLVPFKRVDVIVRAFNDMPDKKLVVVGDGPERGFLQKLAGPNVQFLGHHSTAEMGPVMGSAKAFVYSAIEDFGIVPVEAQAAGVPVIAYGAGGSLETVRGLDQDAPTGVLYPHQTPASARDAIEWFDANSAQFSKQACLDHAAKFDRLKFHKGLERYLP